MSRAVLLLDPPSGAVLDSGDPWRYWSPEHLAAVIGCPAETVERRWPRLVQRLNQCGIGDRATMAALAATWAIETANRAEPVREAFWLDERWGYEAAEAWRAANLWYHPAYGRGDIQCTLKSNYRRYSPKVSELLGRQVDLLADLDQMLQEDVSEAFAACYFRDHPVDGSIRIPWAARQGNAREVRRLVQGGSAKLAELAAMMDALGWYDLTAPFYVFPVEGYDGAVSLHWGSFEGGSDLFAPEGTPVRAIHSGTVVYRAEWDALGGNAVQISGDDGLQSYYAHGDREPQVADGDRVEVGRFLFGVGISGNAAAAGPHLHFGMGKRILTGTGPTGGCGSDYDAVGLLRRLLAVA